MNNEISRLSRGYSKEEIKATMDYFYKLREECRKIMETRRFGTTSELLTYRLASYVIEELWICKRRAKDRA